MSTINRKQVGAGGQGASYRGQRGNLRGWARPRSGGRRPGGAEVSRGGSMQRNLSGPVNGGSGGQMAAFMGAQRGIRRGGFRGARGNLRGAMHGGRGSLNQGNFNNMRGFRDQASTSRGQGQINRVSLKQKRLKAMQSLHQARKTIAQLDQQQARQNFVNARRGILQQTESLQTVKKEEGMYSSNASLASTNSFISSASSSARSLEGTKVTTFTAPGPLQQQRRWRENRSPAPGLAASSTLTISFDNIPVQSGFPTTPGSLHRKQRRRQWRRNKNISGGNNISSGASTSDSNYEDLDNDINRGASASFSQQLSKLKPTVSTKYVFQKKVFTSGNTSFSLNDRFSNPMTDDITGRKVYM